MNCIASNDKSVQILRILMLDALANGSCFHTVWRFFFVLMTISERTGMVEHLNMWTYLGEEFLIWQLYANRLKGDYVIKTNNWEGFEWWITYLSEHVTLSCHVRDKMHIKRVQTCLNWKLRNKRQTPWPMDIKFWCTALAICCKLAASEDACKISSYFWSFDTWSRRRWGRGRSEQICGENCSFLCHRVWDGMTAEQGNTTDV